MAGGAPRVAIIDADRRVRQSLADLLSLAGLAVVGSAGEIGSAASLLDRARPNVLLGDPRLRNVDSGEGFISTLGNEAPAIRIVLMGRPDPMERPSLAARAVADLPKSASLEEFVATTLAVSGCQGLAWTACFAVHSCSPPAS